MQDVLDYRSESPAILRDFLAYHETVKNQSKKTVSEYFLDLRAFMRYVKIIKNKVPKDSDFDSISILDVDLELIKSVTLSDIYEYMSYLSRDRIKNKNAENVEYGIGAAARARKVSSIRSFYKFLTNKARLMDENPMQDLDFPKLRKTLPKYLSLDESLQLLSSVSGSNQERDYCIITLFLNCGLRISELVSLNMSDVGEDSLRVMGKGGKQRVVYLNESCLDALADYMTVRNGLNYKLADKRPLFISRNNQRISTATVHKMIKKFLTAAGLDQTQYSAHKLRHTAATLMLQNGVDLRTIQEILGHEHLNTTEIYTHVENTQLREAARANPLSKAKR